MTRKRWIYPRGGGEPFEVDENFVNESSKTGTDSVLWNDRIYQDDKDQRYYSRKSHREFMRRNGLTTMDDYTNYWKNAAKKREEIRQGKDPERIRHVVEAFNRHSGRR